MVKQWLIVINESFTSNEWVISYIGTRDSVNNLLVVIKETNPNAELQEDE